jgi:Uma2 family endonuclease
MVARARVRFKASDIWDAPDNGKIYEVIDGQLFVSPAPSFPHQLGIMRLGGHLWNWIEPHHLGVIVSAPTGVVLDDENGVQPDLLYISTERAGIISDRGVEGAPDLIVEALSPSTQGRDRGIKMRRYAAAGVPHYWIFDAIGRSLETYRLGANGYELTGRYGPGDILRPELFPGLEIILDEIWP